MGKWQGFICAAAAAIGHSGIDATRKLASQSMTSGEVVALVALLDTCFLAIIVATFGLLPPTNPLGFMTWRLIYILVASSAAKILASVLYQRALQVAPLSSTIPFLAFIPVLLLGTSFILLGEVPNLQGLVGVVIVTGGGFMLAHAAAAGSGTSGSTVPGNAMNPRRSSSRGSTPQKVLDDLPVHSPSKGTTSKESHIHRSLSSRPSAGAARNAGRPLDGTSDDVLIDNDSNNEAEPLLTGKEPQGSRSRVLPSVSVTVLDKQLSQSMSPGSQQAALPFSASPSAALSRAIEMSNAAVDAAADVQPSTFAVADLGIDAAFESPMAGGKLPRKQEREGRERGRGASPAKTDKRGVRSSGSASDLRDTAGGDRADLRSFFFQRPRRGGCGVGQVGGGGQSGSEEKIACFTPLETHPSIYRLVRQRFTPN